jgi:hypothetical protein
MVYVARDRYLSSGAWIRAFLVRAHGNRMGVAHSAIPTGADKEFESRLIEEVKKRGHHLFKVDRSYLLVRKSGEFKCLVP